MFYKLMQGLLRVVLRVYFRKIYLAGVEHIPPDKPIILACNHPNSFMDAVMLAVLLKEPLHFLARSDVFNTRLKRWLLHQFNLLPIYRLQEGAGNLHKNEETFTHCYELFQRNGRVLIFSEGICIQEKRLRPLRKGTARLAFGAEATHAFQLDLQVVPVGINYTYPAKFRKEAMISIGRPIAVKAFKDLYFTQPAKAIMALNKLIEAGLKENMVIIADREQEPTIESLLAGHRLQSEEFNNSDWLVRSNSWLEREQQIVRHYSEDKTNTPDWKNQPTITGTAGMQSYSVTEVLSSLGIKQLIYFMLGLPVYLIGIFLNVLPLGLAQLITRRKVKFIEFYSSVLMVMGLVLYLIYWMSLTLIGFVHSPGTGGVVFFLTPLSGYFALIYQNSWLYQVRKIHAKQIKTTQRNVLELKFE